MPIPLIFQPFFYKTRAIRPPFRTSPLLIPGTQLRASMVIMGAMCLAALIVLFLQSKKPHPPEALYINRLKAEKDTLETNETKNTEE